MILIGTPCRDMVHAGFNYDLACLITATPEVRYAIVASATVLANSRNLLAETAVSNKFSHILFIDSDMRFPPDSLRRLLEHKKEIIGANYLERIRPICTASIRGEAITSKGKTGIEKVDTLGMGCTLIDCNILATLPRPWFSMPYDGEKHLTEDAYFCRHARKHGFNVFVDHDLSQVVKHIGVVELGVE